MHLRPCGDRQNGLVLVADLARSFSGPDMRSQRLKRRGRRVDEARMGVRRLDQAAEHHLKVLAMRDRKIYIGDPTCNEASDLVASACRGAILHGEGHTSALSVGDQFGCGTSSATKDPSLVSVLLEDSAALIGIALAAAGVIASGLYGIGWADGAASVAIGLLLACVAFILANETRSLIAGEAVALIVMERLRETLTIVGCINDFEEIATLHLGPDVILVALTVVFRRDASTETLNAEVGEITRALRSADERVAYVYVRPSERKLGDHAQLS